MIIGLLFAYYNFCRRHMTLKCIPAQEAGVTDQAWMVKELIQLAIPEGSQAEAS
jgi:hypothetical protein